MINKIFYIGIFLAIFMCGLQAYAQNYYNAWNKRYWPQAPGTTNNASAIALDPSGNIITTCSIKETIGSSSQYMFLIIKYDKAGNQLWAVRSAPTNLANNARYLKTDSIGNIYVAGDCYNHSSGSSLNSNCIVIKYNSEGIQQWSSVYDGTTGADTTTDLTSSIDVDSDGNVYLCGSSVVNGIINFLTVKINSSGGFEWKALIPTPIGELPPYTATSVAIDNSLKRVYTAGWKYIVCYDFHGNEIWRSFCGQWPKIMLNNGELYVGFTYNNGPNIQKLNPLTGSTTWTEYMYSYIGLGKYNIDRNGNTYSATQIVIDSLTSKWLIRKYNSSGILQWERTGFAFRDYLTNFQDAYVETDDSLNVYLAGETVINEPPMFDDLTRLTTLVFNKNGNLLQANNYLPPANNGSLHIARNISLAVNKNSLNYYVAGKEKFSPNPMGENFLVINYRSTGLLSPPSSLTAEAVSSQRINLSWKYNSSAPSGFVIERSFDDCSEYFYLDSVSGNTTTYIDTIVGPGTPYCYKMYAYTDSSRSVYSNSASDTTFQTVGVLNNPDIFPKEYKLYQNYPNPFNPITNLEFDLPKSGIVTLRVYDVLGKQVSELINEFKQPGGYKVSWDASEFSTGIYFYKLESGDFTQVKRMILLK